MSYFFDDHNSLEIFVLKPVRKRFFKYATIIIISAQKLLGNRLFASIEFFMVSNVRQDCLTIEFYLGV